MNAQLPDEVLRIWNDDSDGLYNARVMIDEWGLEKFLDSEIHQMAILEKQRFEAKQITGDPKHDKRRT